MKTIVALSTPPGNSGVAVVRISGEKSKQILKTLIKEDLDFEPRKMYLKNVYCGNIVDKCLVVFFVSPFSFTGEDTAEIQSHGGYLLAQKIIEECLSLGAELADKGEFSKRAFINGKMSLDQAEGVIDLINAESELQASSASDLLQGRLKEQVENAQTLLVDILAEIEAKLDYPEYDYTESESATTKHKLNEVANSLQSLINESATGQIIKNGVRVAIVGAPNVGKSSLLNALTKSNKAIVTDIAGTTRDVVEAEYEFNGIIFRLFDTAGIHDSNDVVEKIGIDRALKTLNDADIVVRVSAQNNLCEIETDKPVLDVFNKMDLVDNANELSTKYLLISATNNTNIDKLKQSIFDKTVSGNVRHNQFYLTNTRHIECVKNALKHIKTALKELENTTFDIISAEIKTAWSSLGEITGSVSDEKIIDRIFSKFCLGK